MYACSIKKPGKALVSVVHKLRDEHHFPILIQDVGPSFNIFYPDDLMALIIYQVPPRRSKHVSNTVMLSLLTDLERRIKKHAAQTAPTIVMPPPIARPPDESPPTSHDVPDAEEEETEEEILEEIVKLKERDGK